MTIRISCRRPTTHASYLCIGLLLIHGILVFDAQTFRKGFANHFATELQIQTEAGTVSQVSESTADVLKSTTNPPYAYAFMYWGINPNKSIHYRFPLIHFMLSAKLLHGPYKSQADVIAVFHLDRAYESDTLPKEDEDLLQAAGIKVHYISNQDPENDIPGFDLSQRNPYLKMFQKFYLFRLSQYRRIFFLDADIMLHRNLDYWMTLSEEGVFGEMVMLSGHQEPANGGTFVISPSMERWQQVRNLLVARGTTHARDWNHTQGFGHVIQPPDNWETNRINGSTWDFWAAEYDQGFLYHLCKYEIRHCTHILAREVIDYRPNPNDPENTVTTRKLWKDSVLATIGSEGTNFIPATSSFCNRFTYMSCVVPYTQFTHWTSTSKPWLQKFPDSPEKVMETTPGGAFALWWQMFFWLLIDYESAHPQSTWFREILPPDYNVNITN